MNYKKRCKGFKIKNRYLCLNLGQICQTETSDGINHIFIVIFRIVNLNIKNRLIRRAGGRRVAKESYEPMKISMNNDLE